MINCYYTQAETTSVNGNFNAAGKPVFDTEKILQQLGYVNLGDIANIGNMFGGRYTFDRKIYQFFSKVQAGDSIIFQYPLYISYPLNKHIFHLLRRMNIKIILFMHDFNSLRLSRDYGVRNVGRALTNRGSLRNEISLLNLSDEILVPTNSLKSFLIEHKYKGKIVVFEIYDYLAQNKLNYIKTGSYKKVVFAGNLDKSPFINELKNKPDLHFEVFGKKPVTYSLNSSIDYKGAFPAEVLPSQFTSGFGLVWDGESIETIAGVFGKYLLYSSPYKASMYLANGLPIIVWNKSAIANLVTLKHLGICVDSIPDAVQQIKHITEREYREYAESVTKFGEKLRHGEMLKAALSKL